MLWQRRKSCQTTAMETEHYHVIREWKVTPCTAADAVSAATTSGSCSTPAEIVMGLPICGQANLRRANCTQSCWHDFRAYQQRQCVGNAETQLV